jgi:hypothetical protein
MKTTLFAAFLGSGHLLWGIAPKRNVFLGKNFTQPQNFFTPTKGHLLFSCHICP